MIASLILVLSRIAVFAAVGAGVGLLGTYLAGLWPAPRRAPAPLPFPHVVPKSQDGMSLRFAMVHDVIHERFERHGPAFYQERNRRARLELAALKTLGGEGRPPRYWELLDDLAVGLEMVGEHDEAVRLMRAKLEEQKSLGLSGRDLYSSHANLGTFLILGPFRKVRPGNEDDKKVLREGLEHIHKAIEINPDSHFGREIWQAVIIEYMIALYDDPELLLKYDMVGNWLDALAEPRSALAPVIRGTGRVRVEAAGDYLSRDESWGSAKDARGGITKVGAERNWAGEVQSSHLWPVPFDEPTLGIVGMWRLGGGAHPYFAVALGEIMLRVGQDHIAWCAFERAARLAEFAWPDPGLQERFRQHCRDRQRLLEKQPDFTPAEKLRQAFEADLKFGQDHQRAYQEYEADQIQAGRSPDDPHFYDDFSKGGPPVASPVGNADWYDPNPDYWEKLTIPWPVPLAMLGAGVLGMIGALWPTRPTTPGK